MNTYTEQQTSSQISYSTSAVGYTNPGKYAPPLPHTKHPLAARLMLALGASVWWGRKCRRWEAGQRLYASWWPNLCCACARAAFRVTVSGLHRSVVVVSKVYHVCCRMEPVKGAEDGKRLAQCSLREGCR
jgi:hypothetical protein